MCVDSNGEMDKGCRSSGTSNSVNMWRQVSANSLICYGYSPPNTGSQFTLHYDCTYVKSEPSSCMWAEISCLLELMPQLCLLQGRDAAGYQMRIRHVRYIEQQQWVWWSAMSTWTLQAKHAAILPQPFWVVHAPATLPPSSSHHSHPPVSLLFALQYAQEEAALNLAAVSGDVATMRRLIEDHANVNCTMCICNRLKECIYYTYMK